MDVIVKKLSTRILLLIGAVCLCLVALSSLYYKSPTFAPSAVWHGANMSVRTALANASNETPRDYSEGSVKHLKKQIQQGEFEYKAISTPSLSNAGLTDIEIKIQIATHQAQQAQLKQDLGRLKQTNQQLLNSKKVLDGLNQEFSVLAAYQQSQLAQKQAALDAVDTETDAPTPEQVDALMAQQTQRAPSAVANPIPQEVLNNIQQSTGISPDQINELMNK